MDYVLRVFVRVLGFLPYGWFESVVVRMVLADLRFGLVLSFIISLSGPYSCLFCNLWSAYPDCGSLFFI